MTTKEDKQQIDDQKLLSVAKSTLIQSVEDIDEETLDRLAAIRCAAIETASQKNSNGRKTGWLMPASGFVTAAALFVAVALWTTDPVDRPASMTALEDISILTDSEDLDFYEDLEFYQWLAVNEQAVS